MKLGKIDRLFAAYSSNTAASQNKIAEEKQIQNAAGKVDEAVRVAKDFGSTLAAQEAKSERVAQLKEQVRNNTYNPDTKEVAKSLIRDLFA